MRATALAPLSILAPMLFSPPASAPVLAAAQSTIKVRLGIDKKSVRIGGTVRVRIENLGTQDVAYGDQFELARFNEGAWAKLPSHPVFAPRFTVRGETAEPGRESIFRSRARIRARLTH